MNITLIEGLPFIQCTLTINNTMIPIPDVLLDTGSASCVFKLTWIEKHEIIIPPTASIRTLSGIGGREEVIPIIIERISVGSFQVERFEVEIGAMDYGFDINGIIGMDFLSAVGAVIDLNSMEPRSQGFS